MGEAPERLRRRREFLAVARRGRRSAAPGVVLQAWRRESDDDDKASPVRVGFTVSRKVGDSVVRNRARRRLRAAAVAVLGDHAAPGYDYVLIGRAATPGRPYQALVKDLETAMRKLGVWRETPPDAAAPDQLEVRETER